MATNRTALQSIISNINEQISARLHNTHDTNIFITRFLADIDFQKAEYLKFLATISNTLCSAIEYSTLSSETKIPFFTHRIWLTDPTNPAFPSDTMLANVAHQIKSVTYDYVNFLWSNSPAVNDYIQVKLHHQGLQINCLDPANVPFGAKYLNNVSILIEQKKFVFAADFMRIAILEKFGGIYFDMGIGLSRTLLEIISLCDYVFLLGDGGFIQTSFLAAPAGSALISLYSAILQDPDVLPCNWIGDHEIWSSALEVNSLAGPGFTSILTLFFDPSWKCLLVTGDNVNVHWTSSQSWYGNEAKFGNALISEGSVSILDHQRSEAFHREIISPLIEGDNLPTALKRQFEIIIALQAKRHDLISSLCRLMRAAGSDKALSWHNYTPLYFYILSSFIRSADTLVEIGIGTNNPSLPSSMGVYGIPRASLRAWQSHFNTRVVGGDVDRDILFTAPGIDTLFVDQLTPTTIEQFIEDTKSEHMFLIDDGLHTFEANRNVLEAAIKHSSFYVFVIEDIMERDVELWKAHLSSIGHYFIMVKIPHETNLNDNRLIVIFSQTGYMASRASRFNEALHPLPGRAATLQTALDNTD